MIEKQMAANADNETSCETAFRNRKSGIINNSAMTRASIYNPYFNRANYIARFMQKDKTYAI